jgi:hypothetical protein
VKPGNPPHSEQHEELILRAAFGDPAPDAAAIADQLAACPDCLTFAFRTLDDLFALHTRAGTRRATAVPPLLRSVERLDRLLDDAMVLMAYREPSPPSGAEPGAGEEAEAGGKHSVPIGDT